MPVPDVLRNSAISDIDRLHALLGAIDVADVVVVLSVEIRRSDLDICRVVVDVCYLNIECKVALCSLTRVVAQLLEFGSHCSAISIIEDTTYEGYILSLWLEASSVECAVA